MFRIVVALMDSTKIIKKCFTVKSSNFDGFIDQ